jgi:hypothetical protein
VFFFLTVIFLNFEQKFEPKPREFVQTLATTREKCGKKETTMCEESIVWYPSDPKKDLIYANCHQSAWAIYLHATETDCALCCSTELQETMNEIKKKDSVRISKFITGIKQIEFDSICFVEMKQEGTSIPLFFFVGAGEFFWWGAHILFFYCWVYSKLPDNWPP